MNLELLKERCEFEPNLYDERVMLIVSWAISLLGDVEEMRTASPPHEVKIL